MKSLYLPRSLALTTQNGLAAFSLAALCACACSSIDAEPDTRPAEDAAPATDSALDARAPADAPIATAPDVSESGTPHPRDASAPSDAHDATAMASDTMCVNGMEGPMPTGLCDGRAMTACRLWAEENAGGAPAAAICIQEGDGGCSRADACADARDVATCTCGGGPACDPGEVCALDSAGPAACRCGSRVGT